MSTVELRSETTPVAFGDCVLDLDAYEVRVGGEKRECEPQVFELLAHLVRHPGRLVTKDELVQMVWGGRAVSDAALSSRIKSARRAIGDDGTAQRFIRTVHGRGFCFVGLAGEAAAEPAAPVSPAPAPAAAPADLMERPSVLVLPWQNGTGDPGRDYLADGVTDDLIAALSAWRWFPVISRSTAFVYRNAALPVGEIGRATGARYVVGGRLQQDGARLRATVELVDGQADRQIWSDRFVVDAGDLFRLQEEIAAIVVRAVEPELRKAELRRIQRKPPADLTAWDQAMQALWHANRRASADYDRALALAAAAAERDPAWGFPLALVAFVRFQQAMQGWSQADARTAFSATHQAATAALAVDDGDWMAQALAGVGAMWSEGDPDRALAHLDRALELNPSASYTHHFCGCVSGFAGQLDRAADLQGRVFRIDPAYPYAAVVQADLALWAMVQGRLDHARRHIVRSQAADPDYARGVQRLAALCGLSGDAPGAAKALGRLAKLGQFDRAYYDASYPFRDPQHQRAFLDGLRRAGLNLS